MANYNTGHPVSFLLGPFHRPGVDVPQPAAVRLICHRITLSYWIICPLVAADAEWNRACGFPHGPWAPCPIWLWWGARRGGAWARAHTACKSQPSSSSHPEQCRHMARKEITQQFISLLLIRDGQGHKAATTWVNRFLPSDNSIGNGLQSFPSLLDTWCLIPQPFDKIH